MKPRYFVVLVIVLLVGGWWLSQQHQASMESVEPYVSSACRLDGCSQSLCVGKDAEPVGTTCEWRKEYACYKLARCEVQQNGQCGWTQTLKLQACLN